MKKYRCSAEPGSTARNAEAPIDDEPVTEEEERAVAASEEWLQSDPGIPFEGVVAELGFTMEQVRGYKGPA